MTRFYFTIILSLISFSSFTQITTREIITEEIKKPIIYDSSNFGYNSFYPNENEIKKYIGQEIYILPFSETVEDKTYYDFYNDTYGFDWTIYVKQYLRINTDSFANQKLKITDAGIIVEKNMWYLSLLNNQTSDTIHYLPINNLDKRTNMAGPFILPTFFEKSKKQYLNTNFIAKKDTKSKDINSGYEVTINKGENWTCVDITLVDLKNERSMFYIPVMIFKNSSGDEILVNFVKYNYADDNTEIKQYKNESYVYNYIIDVQTDDFYDSDEYQLTLMQKQEKENLELKRKANVKAKKEKILAKYGEHFGNLINNEKVVVGMNKEMCKVSWGEPIHKDELITENGTLIVWQYDYKTFLYFENDKLKIIKQ